MIELTALLFTMVMSLIMRTVSSSKGSLDMWPPPLHWGVRDLLTELEFLLTN